MIAVPVGELRLCHVEVDSVCVAGAETVVGIIGNGLRTNEARGRHTSNKCRS